MSADKIEALLTGSRVSSERVGDRKWKLSLPGIKALSAFLEWTDETPGGLLRIYAELAKLPPDAGTEFFKEIFRKNRDMGHGAFALKDEDTVVFIDTLELEHCDQNEMDATITWLAKSSDVYKEKLDKSKLPYIDAI